jgi:hypothetical protein
MTKTKTTHPKASEQYWRSLVQTYMLFVENKFHYRVPFEKSAPRDLKYIVKYLRELAEEKHIAWDKPTACRTLSVFLQCAWAFEGVISNQEWFLPTASKFKKEIVEAIKQVKLQKQNA